MVEASNRHGFYQHPPLAVVVPLGNEEGNIEAFLEAVLEHLESEDRIFCIIDKVSKDRTRSLVEHSAREDKRVKLVWAPENRCVVDAYFRGYREALQSDCHWILEMDGGFSHNPAEIPRFIRAMSEGLDFAAGSRFMNGGRFEGPLSRRIISRGGTILANWLLGTRMKDMTSGFECFTRAALEYVVERGVRSRAHFFQTEIRFMLHSWNWREIPITYRNPSKSVGKANVLEAFSNLWFLYKQSRRHLSPVKEEVDSCP